MVTLSKQLLLFSFESVSAAVSRLPQTQDTVSEAELGHYLGRIPGSSAAAPDHLRRAILKSNSM